MLPALLGKSFRFPWLAYAAAALCLTCGLSLSALAAVNWNNGYTVVLRYATWAAMPVTAVCIIGLGWLPARRRWAVLAGVAVCQVFTMWQALWFDGGNNLVHFRLATWVLDHAPGLYNPDPEIFFEREQQMEQELAKDRVIVHRSASGPTKVMRAWSNTANSGGVCPPGQKLVSPGASTADGWDYFNAPFDCRPGLQQGADWAFAGAGGEQEAMLTAGWSDLEPAGVWTEGTLSVLTVPLPQGSVFRRLDIEGEYFLPGKVSETDVTINGVHIGRVRLGTGPIAIPPAAANGASLRIELRHAHPVSPQSLSMSDDIRPLAFFLKRIYLDRGKAN
jgi:hypothetical protein